MQLDKHFFGSYSHSGIPGFPFRLFCSQEQNSRKSKASLRVLKTAIDYHERHLKIAKELRDKTGSAISFYGLGKNFELQGSLWKAVDCFRSSVRMYNIARHHLEGKDESVENQLPQYE